MSTDWNKYRTAVDTRSDGRQPPLKYGVVSMMVSRVRQIQDQQVIHKPLIENRAHTDVEGEKTAEARVLLRRLSEWKINLEDPVD